MSRSDAHTGEIKLGMAFAPAFVLLGNQREQVLRAGLTEPDQRHLVLGSQLAAWRAAAGETQRSLSVKLPYSRSTIANVEVGRQAAPRDFWQRCDELLGAAGSLLAGYDELELASRLEAETRARELSKAATTAGPQPPKGIDW